MTLVPGNRLGPYEIVASIGAGGMGEVYRARDTRLKRDVALKILPESFASDPDRLARFQREAEVLASLNHPNIAAIHGLEESEGTRALVMELIEGETLADRIARGAIPIDEALPIARQIAEALETAHEQGIIHRDLKPANIKVRPDGTVKVLDFGLAKLAESTAVSPVNPTAASMSPTITSPALMSGVGVLLGTAAYMSPEQARGKPVDKRSDIWAFGCVLYEMLTGRRAFDAGEVSDTLAMVLMKDIDWTSLPATTPHAIRTLLRRCLEKDQRRRLPDISVARLDIDDGLATAGGPITSVASSAARGPLRLAWVLAAVAGVVAITVSWFSIAEPTPRPPFPIRFQVPPPAAASFRTSGFPGQPQALSPDGRSIVFEVVPAAGGPPRLAIRAFDEDQARELPGTEGAFGVFWSPDSRFIGFIADRALKRMDVTGGPPQILCDLPVGGLGGTWSSDGTILIAQTTGGLLRVSSAGGTPIPATMPDTTRNESSHGHPSFLPDGHHFLYHTIAVPAGSGPIGSIYVGSLDGASPVAVGPSDSKAVYADGFLLFVRNETLMAQPFDTARLKATGDPVVVAQNIPTNPLFGTAAFSASAMGVVSYRAFASSRLPTQLTWLDRSGKIVGTVGKPVDQTAIALSVDSSRVAISVLDPALRTRDIWIHDLARDLRTRFTFEAGEDWASVWSPDGRTLVFSTSRMGPLDVYQKAADGSGAEEQLVEGGVNKYVTSWSPDGRFVLYYTGRSGAQAGADLWVLPMSGDRKPRRLLQTTFDEREGEFSPDGRWIAYVSNESGREEIYVMPFPSPGGKWQISTTSGQQPKWRGDGKELFYLSGDMLMAAEVNGLGPAFQVGAVRRLFEVPRRTASYLGFGTGNVYDVAADGQRFLVGVVAEEQVAMPPPITVITNWTATLR